MSYDLIRYNIPEYENNLRFLIFISVSQYIMSNAIHYAVIKWIQKYCIQVIKLLFMVRNDYYGYN